MFNVELILSEKTYAQVNISPKLSDKLIFNITSEGVVQLSLSPTFRHNTKNTEATAKTYINTAILTASSASNITVGTILDLNASASSAARINYCDTPKLREIKKPSDGRIKNTPE